jgi:hypothetical protein
MKLINGKVVVGHVFVGAVHTTEFLLPFLLAFDKKESLLDHDTQTIVQAFEGIPESSLINYDPNETELNLIGNCYDKIVQLMKSQLNEDSQNLIKTHANRLNNWIKNNKYLFDYECKEKKKILDNNKNKMNVLTSVHERLELQKTISSLENEFNKFKEKYDIISNELKDIAEKKHEEYKKRLSVNLHVIPNLVVKLQ